MLAKKAKLFFTGLSVLAAANSAFAGNEISKTAGLLTASPTLAVTCAVYGDTDNFCLTGTGSAALLTTSSVLLLRDIQAVQPDALRYMEGQDASPLLESVASRLQDVASEHLGREMTFNEAVNDIISQQ